MPSLKPLSYVSFRTVILYLEPSLRILISAQLPTIQPNEKAVPLKLKSLEISDTSIKIGELYYELGITRFDKHGDHWRHVKNSYNCKVFQDVDRYGLKVSLMEATPGDLAFEEQEITETTEEQVMEYLDGNQNMVAQKEAEFWKKARQVVHYQRLKDQFAYKKDNMDSLPFMHLLHLTIRRQRYDESDFHEFVVYTGSLPNALKYLNTRILGGRRVPIQVQNLEILPSGRIRLPENWKIEVQHLKVQTSSRSSCLEVIRPIIATFPLETITVTRLHAEDYPMLASARKVVISPFVEVTPRMPFQRVHFDLLYVESETILTVLENLRVEEQPIGTYYSFDMLSFYSPEVAEAN